MKVSIIYGSTTGNTEKVAGLIKEQLTSYDVNLIDVSGVKDDDYNNSDLILLGSSTWGYGDLQDDFAEHIDSISSTQLANKKVAVFGCGDSVGFGDVFCEAVNIINEKARVCGAQIVHDGLKVDGDVDDNLDNIIAFAKSL